MQTANTEACLFADRRKNQLQHEYDNAFLFSDSEAEQVRQMERSQQDFLKYFDKITITDHVNASNAIIINWKRVSALVRLFVKNEPLPFIITNLRFSDLLDKAF